jgi:hypothetical protein
MEQEARTRLTKESIHGELMRVSRRRMLICTAVFALSLVVVVPIGVLFFQRIADEWKWLVIFLFTVTYWGEGVYLTLPAGLEFWRLITGRYRIEEDTLVEIRVEETLRRRGLDRFFRNSRYKYESSLHFGRYGRVVTTKRVCEHSTVGDSFYLVVLNDRKNSVARMYNKKYYRLEEY